jgi:hypothetical protein
MGLSGTTIPTWCQALGDIAPGGPRVVAASRYWIQPNGFEVQQAVTPWSNSRRHARFAWTEASLRAAEVA